ncbi:uncharacterized protein LACBIDRAFT_326650 [Laccaria bicolor S238N-H82]|uniref:Predicted protein n=1 Tax=Laccaria bicolor (strain S238N-H82 / ATCC MYA-4686) TaxID=486041 RepID=B0D9C4_LACBS|nr:uncharacterized protein LACBIDRAFT_326650 [Laccaria bicolor S238N-H82]EDR08993.1 predicted protein [Laccaria bicolor S238N-H82]|eukprot:XP_001880306.1 predicted protein [Laccaria bicolor S238N-H82]
MCRCPDLGSVLLFVYTAYARNKQASAQSRRRPLTYTICDGWDGAKWEARNRPRRSTPLRKEGASEGSEMSVTIERDRQGDDSEKQGLTGATKNELKTPILGRELELRLGDQDPFNGDDAPLETMLMIEGDAIFVV